MGASTFSTRARGKTAEAAFRTAVEHAQHEYGHGGYTGTIAEKMRFRVLDASAERPRLLQQLRVRLAGTAPEPWLGECLKRIEAGDVDAMADVLIALHDNRIVDKRGPAGCFEIGPNEWLFFGLASA